MTACASRITTKSDHNVKTCRSRVLEDNDGHAISACDDVSFSWAQALQNAIFLTQYGTVLDYQRNAKQLN